VPVIRIDLNFELEVDQKRMLQKQLSVFISEILSKNITDIMVIVNYNHIFINGSDDPSAFIEVLYLSNPEIHIKKQICSRILESLRNIYIIDSNRIYINFRMIEQQDGWRFIKDNAVCQISKVH